MSGEYHLTIKTMLTGRTVHELLTRACSRPYRVQLDDIDAEGGQLPKKRFRIVFAHLRDYQNFRRELHHLATKAPKPQPEPEAPAAIGAS